jgi:hypothetical protein
MRWVVIRITGDIVKLLELAEVTGSREELLERIQYLNKWGEGYGVHINVEMLIIKVDLEELEADVAIRFFTGDDKPVTFPVQPEPKMFGGLNLYKRDDEYWAWSVNT